MDRAPTAAGGWQPWQAPERRPVGCSALLGRTPLRLAQGCPRLRANATAVPDAKGGRGGDAETSEAGENELVGAGVQAQLAGP